MPLSGKCSGEKAKGVAEQPFAEEVSYVTQ